MTGLIGDLRYAIRSLRKNPGFTVVAVVTLALGIGANTAIFSLVDAFLLRQLPVKEPEQLVVVHRVLPRGGHDFPYVIFEQFRDHNHSFSGMFAVDNSSVSITRSGQAEMVSGDFVSGSYFDVLGVRAMLGRTLNSDDDRPGVKPVAVISYSYWQRRFGGDPSALGQTIYLARIPFTIVGITSPLFFGRHTAGRSADVVLPMFMQPQLGLKDHDTFGVMARLKPGVTREQASADLDVIYHQALYQAAGSHISPQIERDIRAQRIELEPGLRGTWDFDDSLATELRILMAVVGIALLIACVNVANLLLARASAREKEIAVRLAIGASRARLVRQLLTESVLLALVGGAFGLVFAVWGVDLLVVVLSYGQAPIAFEFTPDLRVLSFAAMISFFTGILFGLAPASAATRIGLNPVLKGTESGMPPSSWRKPLVISQVALSFVLLIGAGLLLRSLRQMYRTDFGFNRDRVLIGWVMPALARYDHAREMNLYREMLARLNAIPGAQSASLSRYRLIIARPYQDVWVQGNMARPDQNRQVYYDPVGPRFFETMGIRLLMGRGFARTDTESAPRVAVISESMARTFFPNQNPVGRRFGFGQPERSGEIEVVGVVKDIKHRLLERQGSEAVYLPYTQASAEDLGQMNFVVRAAIDPASLIGPVRKAMNSIDKDLPLVGVETQAGEVDEYLGAERSLATLLSIFGLLALLLASIGLYGTVSHEVWRRTRELGIRMALGARGKDVTRMIMGEVLWTVGIGVAVGIPAAAVATRLIASMLFQLKPTDPLTIAATAVLMLTVASLAGYLPARRATRVDPMTALRYE